MLTGRASGLTSLALKGYMPWTRSSSKHQGGWLTTCPGAQDARYIFGLVNRVPGTCKLGLDSIYRYKLEDREWFEEDGIWGRDMIFNVKVKMVKGT